EKSEVRFRKVEIRELVEKNEGPGKRFAPAVAPFDEHQAQAYQEAWATQLGIPAVYKNSLGMTLRLIPPGEFSMGSSIDEQQTALAAMQRNLQVQIPDDEAQRKVYLEYLRPLVGAEGPVHRVTLTQAFYMGTTEVTFAQFEAFINASHYVTSAEKSAG